MTSPSNDNSAKAKAGDLCPVCDAPSVADFAPFCSKRCANVDLHRWLAGNYAIPANEADSDDGADRSEDD